MLQQSNTYQYLPHGSLTPSFVPSISTHILIIARTRAYQRFAEAYTQWVAALFDECFINGVGSSVLEQRLRAKATITSADLALAWWSQSNRRGRPTTSRQLADVMPIAAEFLRLFEDEISTYYRPATTIR